MDDDIPEVRMEEQVVGLKGQTGSRRSRWETQRANGEIAKITRIQNPMQFSMSIDDSLLQITNTRFDSRLISEFLCNLNGNYLKCNEET